MSGANENKVTGIPSGSSIRRAGSGGPSGIPAGSSVGSGGRSGGGSSGIPAGSSIKRKKRGTSGIPAGSSLGGSGRGGSSSGIPAGSKGERDDESKKAWGAAINAKRRLTGGVARNSVSGIPAGSAGSSGGNGFSERRTTSGVPAGASNLKGRGRARAGSNGIPIGGKDDTASVERKDAAGPIEVIDDEKGIVEAFVSVTGVKDNVDDIIEPGAYEKTLQERTPKGVWSHAWEHPVSKTLDIREMLPGDPDLPKSLGDGTPWPDEAGALWVKTQFNLDSDRGREAYSMVKFFGDDGSWSIGYRVPKNGSTKDAKTGVRKIHDLNLYEYSPVLHGAAPLAKTRSVKSLDEAMAALEDAGYDTEGLELPADDVVNDGLDQDEIEALKVAYGVVGAYLDAIGETKDAVLEEQENPLGWLADELADVLDPEDYGELLEYAAAFDQAFAFGGDEDAEVAIDEFLDVLDAEIEVDPEMAGLTELISAVLDDRYPDIEGMDLDDEGEFDEGEFDEGDDAEDEFDEGDDEGEYDGDGATYEVIEGGDGGSETVEDAGDFEVDGSDGGADVTVTGTDSLGDAAEAVVAAESGDLKSFYDQGEVKSPSAKERRNAASSGAAMRDGSYPIRNGSELRKAWNLRNNGNADASAVAAHISKRANALGLPHPGKESGKKGLADISWDVDGIADSIMGSITWDGTNV